jgi:hypothetical protein
MARVPLCAAILLAAPIAAAQPPNGGGPGPVLGIVEIPEMFFIDPQRGGYAPRAALTLFTDPEPTSRVAAVISSPEAVDHAEYGYEEAGALVYGRQDGYFLIRTARGMAWLDPQKAGAFHGLEELLSDGLTYLTDRWDGFVSPSPGTLNRTRVARPPGRDQEDVRVGGFRGVGGRLWVQVEVMSHSICESVEPPTVKARGWVPAHDEAGAPTVWFYSRGC